LISKEKIKKCAEAIVYGMNLKEGEAIIIRGGAYARELLEEIGITSYRKGAQPLIIAASDNYTAKIYEEIPKETLATTPKHYLGAVKGADAIITVEPFKDPAVQTKFPREKISARTKANVPIRKILYGEETGIGKRWTYAGWPTPEAAKFFRVEYEDLEHLIIDGIMVSPATLKSKTARLAQRLKEKNVLRITDQKGTDFKCKIEGRRINEDDGVVDEHDIEINDLGNNLPAGEVFIAPHETFGEGTLFCPITIDRFTHKIIRNATLYFKDGKLLLDKCNAEVNREQMIDSFKQCIEIDKNEGEKRTTNIAELGIGCNPAVDKAIGYILTDEKLSGSIHVAFGSNQGYGGTSKSCMHWDFVTDPTATIESIDTNEVIMKNGKIL
jgi:aminopeptidase